MPRCMRHGISRRGPAPLTVLARFAVFTSVLARETYINPPGCGDFHKGDGVPVPTCGNKSEFACGPDHKPLGFIHIPKTAGTTIEALGRHHGVRWGRFHKSRDPRAACLDHEVHPGGVSYVPVHPAFTSFQASVAHFMADQMEICSFCHVPPHRFEGEFNPYDEGQNFCVLRNPYKRMVSEFTYLFCYDCMKEGYDQGFRMHQGLFDIPGCSPENLNHYLQAGIRRYVSKDPMYMFKADCHFLSQYDYAFGPDGRQWCHHPLKFEDLPHTFNSFMEEQGLPIRMQRKADNPSACAARKCNVTVHDLTPETRALIEDAYSKDFEIGGYALWGNGEA